MKKPAYVLLALVVACGSAPDDASESAATSGPAPENTSTAGVATSVGAIAGQFSVSQGGAATYTIPIAVPPGSGGMTPHLNLLYTSGGPNGDFGMGWSLSGTSAIARCAANMAYDGFVDGVDIDGNDRLCLDGQRLIAVDGAYGAHGTEYRTDPETFTQIKAFGGINSPTSYFVAKTKGGITYEYGKDATARVRAPGAGSTLRDEALAWQVSREVDTAGNYVSFSYQQNVTDKQHRLSEINYGGNTRTGQAHYAKVALAWELRGDPHTAAMGGGMTLTNARVHAIRASIDGVLSREYVFGYEVGGIAKRSQIMSLTECAGSGTAKQCLPPTTFTWTTETLGYKAGRIAMGYAAASGSAPSKAVDVDGDGRTDILNQSTASLPKWTAIYKATGGAQSNFAFAAPEDLTGQDFNAACFFADLDGDGRPDVVRPTGLFPVFDAPPRRDGVVSTALRGRSGYGSFVDARMPVQVGSVVATPIDADGDGRADLVARGGYLSGTSTSWYGVFRSKGDGTFVAPAQADGWQEPAPSSSTLTVYSDFTGDGLPDYYHQENDQCSFKPSNGGTTHIYDAEPVALSDCPGVSHGSIHPTFFVDLNGDGLADRITYDVSTSRVRTSLSTGSRTQPFGAWRDVATIPAIAYDKLRCFFLSDPNGDGFPDVHLCNDSDNFTVYYNTGEDFAAGSATTIPAPKLSGDFDGDGAADLLGLVGSEYQIFFANNAPPPAITSIASGLGGSVHIQYKPLTDPSVYRKYDNAVYPLRDVQNARRVVSRYTTSNGIGGQRAYDYTYEGLRADASGLSAGFASVVSTDVASQLRTVKAFREDYPFIGWPASEQVWSVASGKILSSVANTYNAKVLGSDTALRRFPFLSKRVTRAYDIETNNAVASSTVETFAYEESTFQGNLTSTTKNVYAGLETSGSVPYETRTTHTYKPGDLANWILGRLASTTVDKRAPGDTEASSRKSAFDYDATTGLLSAESLEPNQAAYRLRTEYSRDLFGNITSTRVGAQTAAVRETRNTYDDRGRFITSTTNALGQTTTTARDTFTGAETRVTDARGLAVSTTLDVFGRPTLMTRADGTTATLDRAACGAVACPPNAVVKMTSTGSEGTITAKYLDVLEREIMTETRGFDGRMIQIETEYDAEGQVARKHVPHYAGSPSFAASMTYDDLGRVTRVDEPADANGTDRKVTTMSYAGLSVTQTDALGHTTTRTSRPVGGVASVTDSAGKKTTYAYDNFDNVVRITDPAGNALVAEYDVRGRKTKTIDPDMGTWTYGYNAFGELTSTTDAKGQVTTLQYDGLGRMTSRSEPEGVTTWTWDTAAKGQGSLARVTGPNGYVEQYVYDAYGRLQTRTQTIAGTSYAFNRTYDAQGRLAKLTYPSGFKARYAYNAQGYLDTIADDATGAAYVDVTSMDAWGNATAMTLGNGVTTTRTFDAARNMPTSVKAALGTNGIQNMAFSWDVAGNLTSRKDVHQGGLTETFTYDVRDRLLSAALTGGASTNTDSFTYDDVGNIKTKSGVGTYAYGPRPHAVTSVAGDRPGTFAYDENGNMISGWNRTITWNSANLPTEITKGLSESSTFEYGPQRERLRQITTGTTTRTVTYAGSYEKVEEGGQVTHRNFIEAFGSTIAVVASGAAAGTQYMHHDHLGSVVMVTDAAGAVLERLSYDAFGKRRLKTWLPDASDSQLGAPHKTERGYTGHEQLDRVGLVHMKGRVYDPVLGRFLSADPFVQFPDSTQGLNRYTYVDNNPLSFSDPSGHFLKHLFHKIGKFFHHLFRGIRNFLRSSIGQLVSQVVIIVASVAICGPAAAGCLAIVNGVGTGITAAARGASLGDALRAGIIAGASAYANNMIGAKLTGIDNVVAHGAVGGLATVASGGKFGTGFLTGALGAAASPYVSQKLVPGTLESAVLGGVIEEIGGGKFANGALTGASQYALNYSVHHNLEQLKTTLEHNGAGCSLGGPDGKSCKVADVKLKGDDGTIKVDVGVASVEGNWMTRTLEKIQVSWDRLWGAFEPSDEAGVAGTISAGAYVGPKKVTLFEYVIETLKLGDWQATSGDYQAGIQSRCSNAEALGEDKPVYCH